MGAVCAFVSVCEGSRSIVLVSASAKMWCWCQRGRKGEAHIVVQILDVFCMLGEFLSGDSDKFQVSQELKKKLDKPD